jgi:hypothetical protein
VTQWEYLHFQWQWHHDGKYVYSVGAPDPEPYQSFVDDLNANGGNTGPLWRKLGRDGWELVLHQVTERTQYSEERNRSQSTGRGYIAIYAQPTRGPTSSRGHSPWLNADQHRPKPKPRTLLNETLVGSRGSDGASRLRSVLSARLHVPAAPGAVPPDAFPRRLSAAVRGLKLAGLDHPEAPSRLGAEGGDEVPGLEHVAGALGHRAEVDRAASGQHPDQATDQ